MTSQLDESHGGPCWHCSVLGVAYRSQKETLDRATDLLSKIANTNIALAAMLDKMCAVSNACEELYKLGFTAGSNPNADVWGPAVVRAGDIEFELSKALRDVARILSEYTTTTKVSL